MSCQMEHLPRKKDQVNEVERHLTRVGDILRSLRPDHSNRPESAIQRRDDEQLDKPCLGCFSDSTGSSTRSRAFSSSSRREEVSLPQRQRNSNEFPQATCYGPPRQRVISSGPHDDARTEQVDDTARNQSRTVRAQGETTQDPGNPSRNSNEIPQAPCYGPPRQRVISSRPHDDAPTEQVDDTAQNQSRTVRTQGERSQDTRNPSRAGATIRLVHSTSVEVQTHFDCDNGYIQDVSVAQKVGLRQRASRTCWRGLSCGICFAAGAWAHEGHGVFAIVLALAAVCGEMVFSECATIPRLSSCSLYFR